MVRRIDSTGQMSIRSSTISGSLAGFAFLIVQLSLMAIIHDQNPWTSLRMMAAIPLGEEVLPPPASFDLVITLVALLLHFALSILYTSIGALVSRPEILPAALMGAILGLLLYMINFYIFTGLFPWFQGARNWISITTHIVFGMVASLMYLYLEHHRPDPTKQPAPV